MKEFMTHIVTLVLLAALLLSAITERDSVTAIVVVAYWVVMMLAIFICIIVMAAIGLSGIEADPEKKNKLAKFLGDAASKTGGVVKKTYNWICLVLIVGGLAYTGWVFTAVCYSIVALMVRLCFSMARDKASELKATA
ncbi:DNZ54_00345 family protein [Buttiauxella gaviniae]|uniref:DNZ54_00345 family protein n=1 Tax=Buttiauxella gaviniae TaxID=82990 RepID=UPI0039B01BA9